MAFTLGTALSGLMQGYQQGIQTQAMQQALAQQKRQRDAQSLAFQALLSGALGPGGGLPNSGAPPVPNAVMMPGGGMPEMPPAMQPPPPPMPGAASVPAGPPGGGMPPGGGLAAPVPAPPMPGGPAPQGGPLPMRGGMGLDIPGAGDASDPGDYIEPPPLPSPAAKPAPAPASPPAQQQPGLSKEDQAGIDQDNKELAAKGQMPEPPAPDRATGLDLSRYFHSVDPQQIAQAVMKAKPGADPETAMMAVQELYKMGTQGSNLERAQTALVLNALYKQGALTERTTHDRATEGQGQQRIAQGAQRIDQGQQRLTQQGQQFQQREGRLGNQFNQRMAILEKSQNPQIRAQATALRARRQAIIDQYKEAAGGMPDEAKTAIAQIEKTIEALYTAQVRGMGGAVPATPPVAPIAPPK